MKAVFCDFYGTVVYENGPQSFEVIKRIFKNSEAPSPEAVVGYWWKVFAERLAAAYGENYQTQYHSALDSFVDVIDHYQASADPRKMCDIMVQHWCNPPIYDETPAFLENLECPIYFVTNSDDLFIDEAVKNHGLTPDGMFTSEQARHSKPRKELFLYALDKAGLQPEEVVHIGDSLRGDVQGAAAAGIKPIWLNREGKDVPEGITAASSLAEAAEILRRM